MEKIESQHAKKLREDIDNTLSQMYVIDVILNRFHGTIMIEDLKISYKEIKRTLKKMIAAKSGEEIEY